MVKIELDLTKDEIEMVLYCLDSAIDVVKLTDKEKESAMQIRNELSSYL